MTSIQKKPRAPLRRLLSAALATGVALATLTAIALDSAGPLEVDGNAINDALGGDDWDVNLPVLKTDHISGTPGVEDAFIQGGSKDERDISSAGITGQYWRYGEASVPDKDDLVHVFAKEYVDAGTKLLYFGATRSDNNGDAAIGFWFLKKAVALDAAPNFTGKHTDGDILITGDFGTAGVRDLNIFVWTGVKDATDPVIPGVTKLNYPLHLVKSSAGNPSTVFCDVAPAGGGNGFCASANTARVPIPSNMSDYRFKNGSTPIFPADGKFPIGTFMEGGIDLGALGLPTDTCFATVLAMTRSSSSTTAQLKDLVLSPFGGCNVEIAKTCQASQIHATGAYITSTYNIAVTAKGGTINNPGFEEDITLETDGVNFPRCKVAGTNTWLKKDELFSLGASLAKDQTINTTVVCDHQTDFMSNNATARASNGVDPLEDSVIGARCGLDTEPALDVIKSCDTVSLVVDGNTVQPRVCNKIKVVNTASEQLGGFTVLDDPDGNSPAVQITSGVPATLAPGADFTVEHCYTPTTTRGAQTTPGTASFYNVATVSAVGAISKKPADDTATRDCPLCPVPPPTP